MAGLKTLAKELQSKGRYGDTVLAHINPQEAGILKALGGSGTRNPDTGLPEYFFKQITQPFVQAVKAVQNIPGIKQVSDVATQAVKPIDQALVGLDKTVGKAIPGGWGTVGQVALSAMGAPVPLQVGYGAARGSGMLRPGSSLKKANLQGAIIGGATAYATAELGEYMRGATPPGTENASGAIAKEGGAFVLPGEGGDILVNSQGQLLNNSGQLLNAPTSGISSLPAGYANATPYTTAPADLGMQHQMEGLQEGFRSAGKETMGQPSMFSRAVDTALEAPGKAFNSVMEGGKSAISSAQDFGKAAIDPETYTGALDRGMTNAGQTFSGLRSLATGPATLKATTAATGINPMNMAGMALYGETSLAGLEEQRKFLEESKRANAISQAEYDEALASINRQRDYAQSVVSENPFNPNPNRDVSIGETYYGRSNEGTNLYDRMQRNLYAMGGQVDDELGGDYSAMGMDQGNLQKGLFGMGYAEGGTPRFLSGGGDGMSDSIKATINDSQPARLADGEFVIPADVVSHLGNGSSKAGAKQLYSMMDKVRKARTGNPKQGKQINPRKYMPA